MEGLKDNNCLCAEDGHLMTECKYHTFGKLPAPSAPSQFNKADGGKSNPLLLEKHMVRALASVNAVLDYGAQKYEPQGWRKVEPERYDKAARRHRKDRDLGETNDRESGLLHLSHEVCNLLFQIEMYIAANPSVDYLTYKTPPTEHRK